MSLQVAMATYKIHYGKCEESEWPEVIAKFHDKLDVLEKMLVERSTKFMGGQDRPMLVDYNCWPFFERMDAWKAIYPEKPDFIPASRFPKCVIIKSYI